MCARASDAHYKRRLGYRDAAHQSPRAAVQIYLDISDAVKFAWKIQRDAKERGHSVESIKASIEARKPDFDAYIDPQKAKADMVIRVRPTILIPNSETAILDLLTLLPEPCLFRSICDSTAVLW